MAVIVFFRCPHRELTRGGGRCGEWAIRRVDPDQPEDAKYQWPEHDHPGLGQIPMEPVAMLAVPTPDLFSAWALR